MNEEDELNKNLIEKETPKRRFGLPSGKKFGLAALVLLVIFALLGIFVVLPVLGLMAKAKEVYQEALNLKPAYQSQDLEAMSSSLIVNQEKLSSTREQFNRLRWTRLIPILGGFWNDGDHLLKAGIAGLEAGEVAIKAIKPYADIIGLKGGDGFEGKTAEDRVIFVVQTLEKIEPEMETIGNKFNLVRDEILAINPKHYPKNFRGKAIRDKIIEAQEVVTNAAEAISSIKPALKILPQLLGEPEEKTYLLLFQNDAELRPTGGFMTAYAILKVHKGKITPVLSEDIYGLDARVRSKLEAPQPLVEYIKFPYGEEARVGAKPRWRVRDMNLSPDFKLAMDIFREHYPGGINGIIAIDTSLPVELLKILGPVGVADWGTFSAQEDPRCNCPQVIYALELLADKPVGEVKTGRKAVLGPLMHSILLNVMGSPRKLWPEFFNVSMKAIKEKHLLFYFYDEEAQKSAEAFNAAGRVKDYEGDYLYINDCNLAGAKSNMFIKVRVEQKIEVGSDGAVNKTLTINYKNPQPASNCNLEKGELCLNAPYRNWFRILVPKGSQLLESSGSETEMKAFDDEELGKTVFSGFFGDKYPLRPEGASKVTLKYSLPFKVQDDYSLLIQKQPGTYGYDYLVEFAGQSEEFPLLTDKEIRFKR